MAQRMNQATGGTSWGAGQSESRNATPRRKPSPPHTAPPKYSPEVSPPNGSGHMPPDREPQYPRNQTEQADHETSDGVFPWKPSSLAPSTKGGPGGRVPGHETPRRVVPPSTATRPEHARARQSNRAQVALWTQSANAGRAVSDAPSRWRKPAASPRRRHNHKNDNTGDEKQTSWRTRQGEPTRKGRAMRDRSWRNTADKAEPRKRANPNRSNDSKQKQRKGRAMKEGSWRRRPAQKSRPTSPSPQH